jgi:hypothetical protein
MCYHLLSPLQQLPMTEMQKQLLSQAQQQQQQQKQG